MISTNKKNYDLLIAVFTSTYTHADIKTIKSNLTRLKNKKNADRSDVVCAKPSEFIEYFLDAFSGSNTGKVNGVEYYKFEAGKKTYKDCKVEFVSTKGSTHDQLFTRNALFKYKNPSKFVTQIFACQDGKGDSQTTVTSRLSYIKKLWQLYQVFGSKVFSAFPDLFVITPQNKGSFEARIDTELVTDPSRTYWIVKFVDSYYAGRVKTAF